MITEYKNAVWNYPELTGQESQRLELHGDPRDHKIKLSLSVSANDYDEIIGAIPEKFVDNFELNREIAIMKDVMSHPGNDIIEKVDNTLTDWATVQSVEIPATNRYHLKYRY